VLLRCPIQLSICSEHREELARSSPPLAAHRACDTLRTARRYPGASGILINAGACSALEIARRIISLPRALGLVTPSWAFGADFVLSLPGCSREDFPTSNLS
jgi:hypothetical protein